jgi:hypothetical protein
MILRMPRAEVSKKLNSIQQAAHISLKRKALEIRHFHERPKTVLGTMDLPAGASLDSIG